MAITFTTARTVPRRATAVGVPVATSGPVPRSVGLSRAVLTKAGFESKVGQHHLYSTDGTAVVALGVGEPEHHRRCPPQGRGDVGAPRRSTPRWRSR